MGLEARLKRESHLSTIIIDGNMGEMDKIQKNWRRGKMGIMPMNHDGKLKSKFKNAQAIFNNMNTSYKMWTWLPCCDTVSFISPNLLCLTKKSLWVRHFGRIFRKSVWTEEKEHTQSDEAILNQVSRSRKSTYQ